MLQKAWDPGKMSSRDHASTPAPPPSRAGIQVSEEPWGEAEGPVALCEVEGMGVHGEADSLAGQRVLGSGLQMGGDRQTAAGPEGLMPKQTFSSHPPAVV